MNCIEKKKTLFHFTSANCLLFVLTLSGKGKNSKFSKSVHMSSCWSFPAGLCEGRLVIAPFVYSTCKMSIPDGNYSIST